jgi:hypothetical protein
MTTTTATAAATAAATTTATATLTAITSKQFEMEVKEGLIFIINHLADLWPRTISTHATKGGQRLVNNFAEAMAWFKAANFLDCRISAYPKYTDYYVSRTGIAPSILLVDIDKEHFKTAEEFELTATRTCTNFNDILGSHLPQHAFVLEKVDKFSKFDQPSRRFMHFEEQLLTDGKGDQSHWSTVSFNNCMLRVPGSLNSKLVQFDNKGRIIDIPYDAKVRVVKHWDGNTPSIKHVLLMQYYIWLQSAVIRNLQREKEEKSKYRHTYGRARKCMNIHDYDWIENLLNKPIPTHRNYCVWKILVPYCINIKGLSKLHTFYIIKSWLDKCNSISRLDFNPKQKIDYELDHVGKFTPIRQYQLKDGHPSLYALLEKEGIVY